jgi:hypothetical protein
MRASNGWHADITFERVPSDYAVGGIHTSSSNDFLTDRNIHLDSQNAHITERYHLLVVSFLMPY